MSNHEREEVPKTSMFGSGRCLIQILEATKGKTRAEIEHTPLAAELNQAYGGDDENGILLVCQIGRCSFLSKNYWTGTLANTYLTPLDEALGQVLECNGLSSVQD